MPLGTEASVGPTRHCVRWGPSSPSPKGAQPPNFRPMSVVAKRLDGLRCHLVWRQASAQATLCSMRIQLSPAKGHTHSLHPIFGSCLLWPNGWMYEDDTWYGSIHLGPRHIVLDGIPALRERGTASHFSVHIYCGHGRPSQLLLSSCQTELRA